MKKKNDIFADAMATHRVYHAFQNRFLDKKSKSIKWKFKGYEFIKKVNKYVKTHPEIKIVSCDDALFASSVMVLIPHGNGNGNGNGKSYMGTTVLFIPQCTGEEAIQMFLYPNHEKNLVSSLKQVRKNVRL